MLKPTLAKDLQIGNFLFSFHYPLSKLLVNHNPLTIFYLVKTKSVQLKAEQISENILKLKMEEKYALFAVVSLSPSRI